MVRKLGKYSIEGIPILITQKTNKQVLTILRVFNLRQNCKNLDILYLNTFKINN